MTAAKAELAAKEEELTTFRAEVEKDKEALKLELERIKGKLAAERAEREGKEGELRSLV